VSPPQGGRPGHSCQHPWASFFQNLFSYPLHISIRLCATVCSVRLFCHCLSRPLQHIVSICGCESSLILGLIDPSVLIK
jgi:hypothetical protein